MRIIYLSYARITDYHDPEAWLKKLDFYTNQLEAMTAYAEIKSIHLINYRGVLTRNKVEYHFLKYRRSQHLFPLHLNRYVNSLSPDIVLVHGLVFPWQVLWLIAQLVKKTKILAIHHAEKPLRFPKSILQKIADRFIHGYFFASTELGKMWVEAGQIDAQGKIHEIMEVSSSFYTMRQSNDLSSISKKYLWVGRLDSNKDPITLVKAFCRFLKDAPDATLQIVYRDGHLRNEIDTLLSRKKEFREQITLTEDVAHNELLHWYNNAAFVIASSHYEGSGTAVCEGMSCGCIPILSNIPSFRMMTLHGEVGLLFEPGNEDSLFGALKKTVTLGILAEREKVLKQFHNNLSSEAIARKTMGVISSLSK